MVDHGEPYTREEQRMILDYCEADVEATIRLLERMTPGLELPFALVRGRSMSAAAWVEHRGIPLDCEFLELVRVHWEDIKRELVSQVNPQFGVYDEELSFRIDLF